MFARLLLSAFIVFAFTLSFPSSLSAEILIDDFQVNIEPPGHSPPPVPYVFVLKPPAPNPFNTGTKIGYSIPSAGQVSLTVHDLLGREVASLVNGYRKAGNHQLTFDGSGLASGVFILRLESDHQTSHRKLVLLK